jgi:hypothetical protein
LSPLILWNLEMVHHSHNKSGRSVSIHLFPFITMHTHSPFFYSFTYFWNEWCPIFS